MDAAGADAAPPAPPSAPEPAPVKTQNEKTQHAGAAAAAASAKTHATRVQRVLTSADGLLLRLSKLLSTPSGTDSLLCTLSYTLTFVAAHTRAYVAARVERFAAALAIKATGGALLLPGDTLIATLPATSALARANRATDAMSKLAALVSDFRVFVRLWALLDVYTWARGVWIAEDAAATDNEKEKKKQKDHVQRALVWAEVAATAAFQVLENAAYLADKGVLNGAWVTGDKGKRRVARWWVWSSRFWAAYVGLELARLGWVWAKESNHDDGQDEKKVAEEDRRAKALAWWKQLVSNLAWAPMTLHWSTEEGFISDAWIGFLGIVAGGVGLYEKWKLTAV